MNCLSKFQSVEGSCYELGHTWTPSCVQSSLDIFINCLKYSLQIYTPIHLGSSLISRGLNLSPLKVVKGILQSTAFLSSNGFLMISFFCVVRRIFGRFYFLTSGIFPGFLCSFCAILLEQKSRRGLLALYMFGVAIETVFNIFVNHGLVNRVKNGEVYIFTAAVACIMYFYRNNLLPDGIIKKILRLLLNERKKESSNDALKPNTQDIKLLQFKWINHSAKVFGISFLIHAAPRIVLSAGKWLVKPGYLVRILTSKDNAMFGAFLSSFVLLYKYSEYYLKKYRGEEKDSNALIAGGIAGLSFLFNKSSTIAVYFMSKVTEILYKELSKKGYAPWFSSADILLYALSTGIMFHAAVFEPHSLRPAYWNFLLKLTGQRFGEVNRKRLEPFGCDSARLFPDFDPFAQKTV